MIRYDYGIKPRIMIIGDINYRDYWVKAKLHGVGYVHIPQSILETRPLEIDLLFNNEEYGKKVMQSFHAWIDGSNGNNDAIGFDIIDKGDSGYVLCIYQGIECLIDRNLPKAIQKWVTPMITSVTNYKVIDHVSENYEYFKTALKFAKCHIFGASSNGVFKEFPAIVKKINIYNENDIPAELPLLGYGQHLKPQMEKDRKAFKLDLSEDLDIKRIEGIKYFFPITYEKIVRQGFLNDIINELEKEYSTSQIIQGICNLSLRKRIEKDGDFKETSDLDLMKILEYLLDNHESPRSFYPNKDDFSSGILIDQIKADLELINIFNEEE